MNPTWKTANKIVRAIEEQDCEEVKLILDSGFDVDTIVMKDLSAIWFCKSGSLDIAQLLIDRGCSLVTSWGSTPLHAAVLRSDIAFAKLLIKNNINVTHADCSLQNPLHVAVVMNNYAMVELLLKKFPQSSIDNCDCQMRNPLMYACKKGAEDIASLLIANGASANFFDESAMKSPLIECLQSPKCTPELVTILLDAGADITNILSRSNFLAYLLSSRSSPQICSVANLLVDRGCDVNHRNSVGLSLLHCAVYRNNEALLRNVLNAGAYLNDYERLLITPQLFTKPRFAFLLEEAGLNVLRNNILLPHGRMEAALCRYARNCQPLKNICRMKLRLMLGVRWRRVLDLELPQSLRPFLMFEEH